MDLVHVVTRSLRATRDNKLLWGFGLLAGGLTDFGVRHDSGANSATPTGEGPAAPWLLVVLALALAFVVAHLVSEGALIEGIRKQRTANGGAAFRRLVQRGLARAWPILMLKLGGGATWGASAALLLAPLWAYRQGWLAPAPALLLGVPFALVGIPWLLTLSFIYLYALRFVVVQDQGVVEAVRNAKHYLHGHIAQSLRLMVLDLAGLLAGGALAALLAAPGVLLGIASRDGNRRRLSERRQVEPEASDESLSPEALAQRAEVRERLLSALESLSDRDREIVCLRYGAQLEAVEVAELCNTSAANVRKVCERQRQRLVLCLQASAPGAAGQVDNVREDMHER
jgi:RNA polymerase sigma factor (sigma-70 family)